MKFSGGDERNRTADPLLARQVLSQLSYTPTWRWLLAIGFQLLNHQTLTKLVGLGGLEPPTSRLSGVRSNQLSYKPFLIRQPPAFPCRLQHSIIGRFSLNRRVRDGYGCFPEAHRHRKSFVINFSFDNSTVKHNLLLLP